MTPTIREQIAKLKKPPSKSEGDEEQGASSGEEAQNLNSQRLDSVEHLLQEMNERLKSIESRLAPKKN
jgi:hypothetical protein